MLESTLPGNIDTLVVLVTGARKISKKKRCSNGNASYKNVCNAIGNKKETKNPYKY